MLYVTNSNIEVAITNNDIQVLLLTILFKYYFTSKAIPKYYLTNNNIKTCITNINTQVITNNNTQILLY